MAAGAYLLEAYAPQLSALQLAAAAERARAAAHALTGEGTPVAYRLAIYLPADETCFHLFEGASVAAIEAAAARTGLTVQRIAHAIEQQ